MDREFDFQILTNPLSKHGTTNLGHSQTLKGKAGVVGCGCMAPVVMGRDLYYRLHVILASFGP